MTILLAVDILVFRHALTVY